MEITNLDKIIYQLTVEDVQNVANDELDRDLTDAEINLIEEKIGNYIDWHTIISTLIADKIKV